jgi:pantothenate kinase
VTPSRSSRAQPVSRPAELAEAARALQRSAGRRILLGITGQPGAGKSTLAAQLVAELGEQAVLVPMDGYHLPQAALVRLGRRARMGAPDTFDVAGYVAMLERLRTPADATAPGFDRTTEEPVADAIEIPAGALIVVTEGNYLLADSGGWEAVRPRLDAVWYVDLDDDLRLERLIARHVAFGKTRDAAVAWANGPDARNAEFIAGTRDRADRWVTGS